ncbi:aminopeptidase P family protein [Candidatus Gottesmanbacteria bacterium]|nr:aminopeptidase P family protein [Candidatus Gottesmanbacteria bacterium]
MIARLLKDIDALLITNSTNIRYLTGFVGAAPQEREAYALLTQNLGYLFTNSLYRESAKNIQCPMPNVQWKPVEISREEPFEKKLAQVLTRSDPALQGPTLRSIRLGFEENDLTVTEFTKLQKELKGIKLIPTQGIVEKLRMIKRDDEIDNIRQASKLTDLCFDYIIKKLKPDVTEWQIVWEIEAFIRTRGAELAFSPIAAFGKNSSQPHYDPKRSDLLRLKGPTLQKQDVILLDFGARVNGYCSDMTRVVFVGKPKDEWVKAYEVVLTAQQCALKYLHLKGIKAHLPGGVWASGAQLDRIARKIIERGGWPAYPHSLGHGVGLDIHEAPRLTIKKDHKLKPYMVITVEPGIYIEGQYGIRIEDLVLLKRDGIEILSKSPKELTIL